MVRSSRGAGDYIRAVTITVLFVVILSLVVFAARSYQFSASAQDRNANLRALTSYAVSCVRDGRGGEVTVSDRSGTECLIISEGNGYEHRLYLSDGSLMEEYVRSESAPDPDTALRIGDTEIFDLSIDENGILGISTDEGTAYVNTGLQ